MTELRKPKSSLGKWIRGARDLVSATQAWQDWREEDQDQAFKSVHVEEVTNYEHFKLYPQAIVLVNSHGWDTGNLNSNGRGFGEIGIRFTDSARVKDDPTESAVHFSEHLSLVIDQMVEAILNGKGHYPFDTIQLVEGIHRTPATDRDTPSQDLWSATYALDWNPPE